MISRITILLTFQLLAISIWVAAQEYKNPPIIFNSSKHSGINLFVQNGCINELVLVGNNGKPEINSPPTLGIFSDLFPCTGSYVPIDSFWNAGKITDLITLSSVEWTFSTDTTNIGFVATDSVLYKYEIRSIYYLGNCDSPYVKMIDSILLPGIKRLSIPYIPPIGYQLGVLFNYSDTSKANFQFRDINDMSLISEINLNIVPGGMFLSWNELYIVGTSSDSAASLIGINLDSQKISFQIILDSLSKNPLAVSRYGWNIYVYSAPGDSVATLTRYSLIDSSFTSIIFYDQSGCKAYTFDPYGYYFYCQPQTDTSSNNFDKQILEIRVDSMKITNVFNVNKDVYSIQFPTSGGFSFSPIYLSVLDTSFLSTLFLYDPWSFSLYDSITTGFRTAYLINEIRCFGLGIDDDSGQDPKLNVFPNPTGDYIYLIISEVPSDQKCKLEVFDMLGKKYLSEQIKVKTAKTINLTNYPAGTYLFKMEIGDVILTQIIIKQ